MLCCQRCETPQREPGCGSAVFTPLRRWTQLPSPAPLRAPCPPLASAVRTTLATATAGLHHRAWLPGGCSFQTRLSACLSAISFLSCLSIRGIDFWAAFAALIAVWARQHWDVGARSANKNPVVVQAWATLPWHCRKWRFSRLKSTGSKASISSRASETAQGREQHCEQAPAGRRQLPPRGLYRVYSGVGPNRAGRKQLIELCGISEE